MRGAACRDDRSPALLARHRHPERDRGVRRVGDPDRRGGVRAARGAGGHLRQRRHPVVREADADRARLHPPAPGRHGRPGPVPARPPALEGRPRQGLPLAGRRHHQALPRRRQRREGAHGRDPAGLRGHDGRRLRGRRPRLRAPGPAPDPWTELPRVRLPADDRPAPVPGGQRVHLLHRLGRGPRLHAAGHPGDLRHPLRAGHRQLQRPALRAGRARRPGRVPGRAGLLRRRPGQAGADLEPGRAPSHPGRRQLQRRPPHAAVRRRTRPAGAAAAGAARRPRARVRLRRRGRAAPWRRPRAGAGRWSASSTTGPPSSTPPAERRQLAACPRARWSW